MHWVIDTTSVLGKKFFLRHNDATFHSSINFLKIWLLNKSITSWQSQLHEIFKNFPEISEVILFGSRAKGTSHTYGDVDLAIKNSHLSRSQLNQIKFEIENSDLPYVVDLLQNEQINSVALREHIDRVGLDFYQNNETINHRRDRIIG